MRGRPLSFGCRAGHAGPNEQSDPVSELPEIIAYGFDGRGKGVRLDAGQIDDASTTIYAFTWVHLRRDNEAARSWLDTSGIDSFVIDALTADDQARLLAEMAQ